MMVVAMSPFNSLQLFRDIIETRSLTRGAELNGVSPSAASQHLQELEKGLGLMLVDRSTRPFTLTEAGELYLAACRDILSRWQEFRTASERFKAEVEGAARVAAIYSVGLSEMSQLEAEFARAEPRASLEVSYLRPERVYEAVLSDRADLGLVSYAEPARDLVAIPWRQEEMVLAVAPGHRLAGKWRIRPQELQGLDFIGFDPELPISTDVDRYLRAHDVEVNVAMRFDNLQTVKEAVVLGSGVSIVPERVLRAEIDDNRLIAVHLTEPLFRPLAIIHRKKRRLPRAAQIFLELLRKPQETQPVRDEALSGQTS
jgi:DNA-binding transcriptional LysR family regulator